jgi:hypothetical protein
LYPTITIPNKKRSCLYQWSIEGRSIQPKPQFFTILPSALATEVLSFIVNILHFVHSLKMSCSEAQDKIKPCENINNHILIFNDSGFIWEED